MNAAIASRFPLVCRPKPLGRSLAERIGALGESMRESNGAGHHEQVARASEVFNVAALIASDVGMADLARDLCWRHYGIFTDATELAPEVAALALQPVLNIPRQQIRDGHGECAYEMLQRLYRAAQRRGVADICGHSIDLSQVTSNEERHRKICTDLWAAVLSDGARALARAGRWVEAAEAMVAHRGVGNRLLDGRQIMIMSLLERGLPQQATAMVDSSTTTQSWEHAVAASLRVYCRAQTATVTQDELDAALSEALTLMEDPEPATVVFRVRVGLTALDLAGGPVTPQALRLRAAVVAAARTDAYAARDVLAHSLMRKTMTLEHSRVLGSVVEASGIGCGEIAPALLSDMMTAVASAEEELRLLLAA